jgi:serine/threonine protein kinase
MEEALDEDPTADLSSLLPPLSVPRERLIALHELIKIELEFRWRKHQPITLEDYLQRFPELGSTATLPVTLIYEEYRARNRYGDHPTLASYQQRFPQQFEALKHKLRTQPEATCADTNNPFTKELDDAGSARTLPPPTEDVAHTPAPPARPPSKPGTESGVKTIVPVEGSYELLHKIGHGQFGEVFKARAPGGGTVALKRIFRPLDDAATRRERKALDLICQLNHPFLLQTQLYWVNEGRLMIVMELADGSLADWLEQCKATGQEGIPVQPLLEYFRQAAEALDFLHSQKPAIMHRDIKPANLLRLQGYAKVADFGLLREQAHNLITATYCGTPAYMPPEMWNSKVHRHSDQYSLAVTYAEMRLGQRCFNANNPRDLAFQHLEGRANLQGLEPAEQAVLRKALAPDPEQRFPNCRAFVQALIESQRPAPKSTTTGSQMVTALLSTGLVLALVVIGFLVWRNLFPVPPPPPPPPPPEVADWLPAGWEPKDRLLIRDSQDRRYWRSISRTIDGQEMVMVAIPKWKPSDPKTFYMLQDKVWNDLFRAVLERPVAQEMLAVRLAESGLQVANRELFNFIELGQWRLGALAGPKNLGVEGPLGQLPVVRVTVLEAHVCAEMLGGRLPNERQWLKAAGYGEPAALLGLCTGTVGLLGSAHGPGPLLAAAALFPGREERTGPFVLADRLQPRHFPGIALDRADRGPMPRGAAPLDVSVHGCRDMAGNGYEWTRTRHPNTGLEVPFERILNSMPSVLLVGKSYEDTDPFEFAGLPSTADYNSARHDRSFRIVLEQ